MEEKGGQGTRACILCVDDEPNVLQGLQLNLRRRYEVKIAPSGAAALAMIEREGPPTVVLSDMRMPGMDGAKLLAEVNKVAPDTVRMLLTGQTDLESAVAAINEGQIFRFLTKPCSPDVLGTAVEAAVELHRLRTGERVLLEQTLRGSMEAMMGVLSLANPLAFGRAARIKRTASALAQKLSVESPWEVEIAAMLSQIGAITLSAAVVEKLYRGEALAESERAGADELPQVASRLIAAIPRLEGVRAILDAQAPGVAAGDRANGSAEAAAGQVRGAILRLAIEYDSLEARGASPEVAVAELGSSSRRHDPRVLQAFAEISAGKAAFVELHDVRLNEVRSGMILAEDMRGMTGVLLAPRGFEVTEALVSRFKNFRDGTVKEPVRVLVAGRRTGEV